MKKLQYIIPFLLLCVVSSLYGGPNVFPKGIKTSSIIIDTDATAGKQGVSWHILTNKIDEVTALVELETYAFNPIHESNLSTALADDSIIEIYGSYDNQIDGLLDRNGILVAGEPSGDDVLLASTVIDSLKFGFDGTFYNGPTYNNGIASYNPATIKYTYIIAYDTTDTPDGSVDYGYSSIFPLNGTNSVNYSGQFVDTTNTADFASFGYIPRTSTTDDPTTFTPRHIGDQLVIHTTTNVVYISFGTTTNDWKSIFDSAP